MTEASHPEDFTKITDIIGLMRGASSLIGSTSSTPVTMTSEIVTADMKREAADLKTDEYLLIVLYMAGSYDESSNKII